MKKNKEHYRGCLIGGAIGDAFGSAVEFLSIDAIREKYGEAGITDLVCGESGLAEITDDTQMTLFTAEGILRADSNNSCNRIEQASLSVSHAYLRWLITQGYPKFEEFNEIYDGWLLEEKELHASRAPGNTCLSALLSKEKGTLEKPLNNSKGCGGVMRVAPAGLAYPKEKAFEMGAEFAVITHGHPSGYLSAGALAYIIASTIEGSNLEEAVEGALAALKTHEGHEECAVILEKAVELVDSELPDSEAIKILGEGWVGEESLAIAVYCSLKHKDDYRKAIVASVNHSGDSDSTGAITGNIVGAYLGLSSIPEEWVGKLELKEVIMKMADDLLGFYQKHKVY
ncbi:MAG: ADP-ribosylglycohydrolase family protein [Bacillota bacterium]|nr:ADP-ribosylglycohydrolase family protein [Bacillota bacterium]